MSSAKRIPSAAMGSYDQIWTAFRDIIASELRAAIDIRERVAALAARR